MPAERYVYEKAKRKPYEPVCFRDFTDRYAHGTIRNAFLRLKKKGLVKLHCRSGPAFYILTSRKSRKTSPKMTVLHTVGKDGVREFRLDFGDILDRLDLEDVGRVHDVCLVFSVKGLYELWAKNGVSRPVEQSKDIPLGTFTWSRDRVLQVVLHEGGKVTAYLKCADRPVEVSLDGLVSLSSFLGGVRARLVDLAVSFESSFDRTFVPDVSEWIVSQWHYGRDGVREISGPAFNVTFSTWFGELARIYMRRSGQLSRPRLEILEKPRKSLQIAFAEKIDPTFSVSERLRLRSEGETG
jgi:hypothetical protein